MVSAWDVLARKETLFGKVVVIGGGLVGAETAEYLANQSAKVSIIEMASEIAKGESSTVLPEMKADFAAHGVKEYVNCKVVKITADSVICENTVDGSGVVIDADFVVTAVGAIANTLDLSAVKANVHYCGDCVKPADISNAIRTAYDVANAIN